jgi:hypothetical protein
VAISLPISMAVYWITRRHWREHIRQRGLTRGNSSAASRKDASCRDAWKKRGEVISILANIARKVDRLTYVLDGGPTTADESLRDTAIDLMVYGLKYQTYLADLDPVVAKKLFVGSDLSLPYSDGPRLI